MPGAVGPAHRWLPLVEARWAGRGAAICLAASRARPQSGAGRAARGAESGSQIGAPLLALQTAGLELRLRASGTSASEPPSRRCLPLSNALQGWAQHLELWKWSTIPRESCSSPLSTRSGDTPVSSGLMTRLSVSPLSSGSTSSMRLSQQKCVNSLRNMRVSYRTIGWGQAAAFCNTSVLCALLSLKSLLRGRGFGGFLFMYFDVVWGRLWRCRVEMLAQLVFGLSNSIRVEQLCWW